MKYEPKVSFVLPAYNGERFIAESIQSVLSQTHRNLELIIVIDGATDSTPGIVRSFSDPRMKIIQQPNLGMSFARNRGIALATGDFIGSISHDDVFLPEKTEVQLREMDRQGLAFSFTWAQIIDDCGEQREHAYQAVFNQSATNSVYLREKLAKGNFLLAPSFLCRKECYSRFSWNVALFGLQDYALWLNMCRGFEGAVLDLPLMKYRVHGENVSLSDRFTAEYRWFEVRSAKALAALEADKMEVNRLDETISRANALLERAMELFGQTDTELIFLSYILANRAANIAPTHKPSYDLLAKILTSMGFEYPASLIKRVGENVAAEHQYPVPLVSKTADLSLFDRARRRLNPLFRGSRQQPPIKQEEDLSKA